MGLYYRALGSLCTVYEGMFNVLVYSRVTGLQNLL